MSFRNRILSHIVRKLKVSNLDAKQLLTQGQVTLNGKVVRQNCLVAYDDILLVNGRLLLPEKSYKYYLFNKPEGMESTMNLAIEGSLGKYFRNIHEELFPIGRLDKASCGLMLITNDGHIMDGFLRSEHKIVKKYTVKLDKPFDPTFQFKMEVGMVISGKKTLPCKVNLLSSNLFQIELVQGLNRQIRKMCYQLGYQVIYLERTQIYRFNLQGLNRGELRELSHEEIHEMKLEILTSKLDSFL